MSVGSIKTMTIEGLREKLECYQVKLRESNGKIQQDIKRDFLYFISFLLVSDFKPNIIIEVGIGYGGWAYLMNELFLIKKLILIDREFKRFDSMPFEWLTDVRKIKGESDSQEVLSRVGESLSGKKADLIHIDAAHTYAGVMADYLNYWNYLNKEGIMVFHDIKYEGVKKAFEEIILKHTAIRITSRKPSAKGGIGILINS